jgi:hypothetical protein
MGSKDMGLLGNGNGMGRAIADVAAAYADQNERDFAAHETAAAAGRIAVQAEPACSVLQARRLAGEARRAARGRWARAKLEAAQRLEQLAGGCERIAEQIAKAPAARRSPDRLVSIADPDARPIRKGKLGKPTEFGYVEQLCELTENTGPGARGLILPPQAAPGNPGENTLLPQTAAELEALGLSPREVALDGGFGDQLSSSSSPTLHRSGSSSPAAPSPARAAPAAASPATGSAWRAASAISSAATASRARGSRATRDSRSGRAGRSSPTTSTPSPSGRAEIVATARRHPPARTQQPPETAANRPGAAVSPLSQVAPAGRRLAAERQARR